MTSPFVRPAFRASILTTNSPSRNRHPPERLSKVSLYRPVRRTATLAGVAEARFLELVDPYRHEVGRGHTLWIVQISRVLQRRSGTCTYRGARICSNQIGAQPSDNGTSVVFVQTI